MTAASPIVSLRGVGRVFDRDVKVPALVDVDLEITAGSLTTISGASGSGKSTLLNILGLLYRPTTGSYLLDGADTGAMSDRERSAMRAETLGFVFQAFHLMARRTVLDNVMMGTLYRGLPRRRRQELALDALTSVGLDSRADQPARTLSGGERQRVAIARSLVGAPRLLLCDEPTGNLDSANGTAIVELLRGLLATRAIALVVVTHDPAIAAVGDRQFRVADGRVATVTPGGAP
ncbi:ABC transporter ATP-binding protein [Nocardioides sp.]|uniref:ABC transporter ATP-binding protein n=1 Tax=Nocardioides sp. TaxID=35761 RepID=UPI002618A188|nr:ABC transporter ATP-binding protein [Nocardioides sp.]